ncbi:MAG TPA: Fe-S cluster assembly protein IscX [Phycisphaerae bacterium]|nr:Fe-S cluster assembly protein IscX [Phycisphaerae bacterium]
MKIKWTDSLDIAERLFALYPDQDPLSVRFTDLHDMVCGLTEFEDDPKLSNEAKLEAIQMAWLEEFQGDDVRE